MKFDISVISKSVEKIQVSLKFDKIMGTLYEELRTLVINLVEIFLKR